MVEVVLGIGIGLVIAALFKPFWPEPKLKRFSKPEPRELTNQEWERISDSFLQESHRFKELSVVASMMARGESREAVLSSMSQRERDEFERWTTSHEILNNRTDRT